MSLSIVIIYAHTHANVQSNMIGCSQIRFHTSKARTRRAAEVSNRKLWYYRSEKQVCLKELRWCFTPSQLFSQLLITFSHPFNFSQLISTLLSSARSCNRNLPNCKRQKYTHSHITKEPWCGRATAIYRHRIAKDKKVRNGNRNCCSKTASRHQGTKNTILREFIKQLSQGK